MKKKALMLALVFAIAVALSLPLKADATCALYGKIGAIYYYTTGAYVYVYPTTTSLLGAGYYYYFWIPSTSFSGLWSACQNAYSSKRPVYVAGNAASCPTGTARYGGYLTNVSMFFHY